MKDTIDAVRVWLTDERRQALHAFLGTLATLGVTVGLLNDSQATELLGVAGAALALLQGLLGLVLLRAAEAARWLPTVGRGLIYALAAAGGAAGVAFGLWGEGEVATVLSAIAAALTVLSSLLSVVNVQTAPVDAAMTRREYRASLSS